MMLKATTTPEEYRKPTAAGGNAPLTKTAQIRTPLSKASKIKIRNAALRKHATPPTSPEKP